MQHTNKDKVIAYHTFNNTTREVWLQMSGSQGQKLMEYTPAVIQIPNQSPISEQERIRQARIRYYSKN